jgi:hypothetical protein
MNTRFFYFQHFLCMSLWLTAMAVLPAKLHAQMAAPGNATVGDSALRYSHLIPGEFSYFTVDNLDNLYLVNTTGQLKKLNARGDSAGVFNDVKRYGKLHSIDVTNPLKLLLYYQSFGTVVVLDRFLNVRNVINLRKQNMFNVKTIGTAYDNNIWVYDEADAKLKKVDDNGGVLAATVDFRMLFDTLPAPSQLLDREGFVTLYDSSRGFLQMDYYGALKSKLPFTGWRHIEVIGTKLYGFGEQVLYQYQTGSMQLKSYALPASFMDALQIKAGTGKVYQLQKNGLRIYTVN